MQPSSLRVGRSTTWSSSQDTCKRVTRVCGPLESYAPESQVDKSTFMAAAYAAGGCIRVRVAAARIDARAID